MKVIAIVVAGICFVGEALKVPNSESHERISRSDQYKWNSCCYNQGSYTSCGYNNMNCCGNSNYDKIELCDSAWFGTSLSCPRNSDHEAATNYCKNNWSRY